MTLVLTLLLVIVTLGRGGYAPWATLSLELGATFCVLTLTLRTLLASKEEASTRVLRHRAWKRLPFHMRHPGLARWLTRRAKAPDIEIVIPGEGESEAIELNVGRFVYFHGIPLKRTGLGMPLVLITVWILLGLIPLDGDVLASVSPEAHRWWSGSLELAGESLTSAPWSLAPFVTFRAIWLWFAVLAVFVLALRFARDAEASVRLGFLLLVVGALSGALGVAQWLLEFQSLFGREPEALRATGTFGNPNHYAAYQSMLLFVGLGWLSSYRERKKSGGRGEPWDHHALAFIAGIGVFLCGLGLIMSLSRSGLAFGLVGCAIWIGLTSMRTERRGSGTSRRALFALALAILGIVVWIGIEPLLGRFQLETLGQDWLKEQGRIAVWRDSLPAVGDFWLTGSGLSSFRYVGAAYRSFGGQIFYSWAHNDYLQLAIELGLPGLLLLLWIGAAVVSSTRRVRADLVHDTDLLHLHAGYVAAVSTVALHSFTDFSLHLPANFALFAVVLAAAVSLEPRSEKRTSSRIPRRSHRTSMVRGG
ncbi:MAG: O-antigen ligase domain-containing protein [Acidobacteria bacterium]|nr:MAG: O-antigen ligase domain-containing protein [Acidobacteriota bacterium]